MKTMKRLSAVMAALALSVSAMAVSAAAEEETAVSGSEEAVAEEVSGSDEAAAEDSESTVESKDAYVTISNGSLVFIQEKVEVTDSDNDGVLTISDALYAAHEKGYEGGAAEGYSAVNSDWGLSLAKLWGVENGGSYGYYLNSTMANSLADPLGDENIAFVDAFVYTDTTAFSDAYSYFDVRYHEMHLDQKDTLDLTLSYAGFDENWNTVYLPVKGATITLNGDKTEYVTDDEGKVTVKIDDDGEYVVSAVSDTQNLVPPVCVIVADKEVVPDEDTPEETEEPTDETEEPTEDESEEETEEEPEEDTDEDTQGTTTSTSNPKTSSELQLSLAGIALAGVILAKKKIK